MLDLSTHFVNYLKNIVFRNQGVREMRKLLYGPDDKIVYGLAAISALTGLSIQQIRTQIEKGLPAKYVGPVLAFNPRRVRAFLRRNKIACAY
jgi:hypothetical protein